MGEVIVLVGCDVPVGRPSGVHDDRLANHSVEDFGVGDFGDSCAFERDCPNQSKRLREHDDLESRFSDATMQQVLDRDF